MEPPAAAATIPEAGSAQALTLSGVHELYFEEGELLVPPTFDDTPLEKAAAR